MWVVTILHDMTEAIEKRRLAAQLEIKVQEATASSRSRTSCCAVSTSRSSRPRPSSRSSWRTCRTSSGRRSTRSSATHMLLHGVTGPVSEQQRKSLTRIDSNSQHLLALINDILDITRIEAGRMPLNLSSFEIPELVNEVMSELEPIIRRVAAGREDAADVAADQERSPEGEADCSQSAQQCAEVHAGRVGNDRCVV